MSGDMSPLLRLYELAGAEVDHEAGTFRMNAAWSPKPVDLVVSAEITSLSFENGQPVVALDLRIRPSYHYQSGYFSEQEYEREVRIPIEQLRFLEDEKDRSHDAKVAGAREVVEAVEALTYGWSSNKVSVERAARDALAHIEAEQ